MKALKYIGAIALAVFMTSCSDSATEQEAQTESAESIERAIPVKTEKLVTEEIDKPLTYPVSLAANNALDYAPASPGRIDEIKVDVGDRVTKGQVLVEMDKTQLLQAEEQLMNTKITFQRTDTLHKQGSISQQQYDQVKMQYDVQQAQVDFLRENTTLRSPMSGLITEVYFENGELYSAAPNSVRGKAAVVSIGQTNPLKAVVNVAQSYFLDIKTGMKAKVEADLYPGKTFSGKVSKVYPVINEATRTFKVELLIDNNQELLRPGMSARLHIDVKKEKVLSVPAIAVLKQAGTNNRYVFVNDNGTAKYFDVKMGKRFNDRVEIISNELSEGMDIVVNGQANLLDGSKLKIVK